MLWFFLLAEVLLWIALFGFKVASFWIAMLMAAIGALFVIYLLIVSPRRNRTNE